jgi:hypothetical protein
MATIPGRQTFADETEFLAVLRRFFIWQVSRDISPSKPSETEAWQGFLGLLYRDNAGRRLSVRSRTQPKRGACSRAPPDFG